MLEGILVIFLNRMIHSITSVNFSKSSNFSIAFESNSISLSVILVKLKKGKSDEILNFLTSSFYLRIMIKFFKFPLISLKDEEKAVINLSPTCVHLFIFHRKKLLSSKKRESRGKNQK